MDVRSTDSGIELARAYHRDVVGPLLRARSPTLRYAVGRLGWGSEVLGLEDAMSQDHDWGLRLTLLVPRQQVAAVDTLLADRLPQTFAGRPTRFATTWDPVLRHRVEVADPTHFAVSRLGVDPSRLSSEPRRWLALTGQSVLEVVGGPVLEDTDGRLTEIRSQLTWYPDDVWLHVLAADWHAVSQELPFVGHTADVGDDLGSRVIAARLARVAMHLAFLLERTWPPYAKWLGTVLATLHTGAAVQSALDDALAAQTWPDREAGLVAALTVLWERQRALGLPVAGAPTEPFWDRPYRAVPEQAVAGLLAQVGDPQLAGMPCVGAVEQWVKSVDLLVDPVRRQHALSGERPPVTQRSSSCSGQPHGPRR